jgi:hypothetical protein
MKRIIITVVTNYISKSCTVLFYFVLLQCNDYNIRRLCYYVTTNLKKKRSGICHNDQGEGIR